MDRPDFPDVKPGNYVHISVNDNGIGMDRPTIEKIFEPFYTTKEKGHGTGLGMATVYGIVKQNNGYVKVDSIPEEGSTISILWPSADEQIAVNGSLDDSMPEEEKLRGNEQILVVEDDKDVLYFTSFALRNLGYNVQEAPSGLDALHMIKVSSESKIKTDEIELIITDLIMPGMNGKELAQKIHEFKKSIKILFTSGYEEAYIADNEIISNSDNFLQKPFTIRDLAEKVRCILDDKSGPKD
jgi:CheY-like chemotaxis protein